MGKKDSIIIEKKELEKIISEGNFDGLIGKIENQWLECKGNNFYPDIKNSNYQKKELAKDVSSLANLDGGYILLGVGESNNEKTQTGPYSKIEKIELLKEERVNIKQYKDIIRSWVYPKIRGLDIKWFSSSKNKDLGIFIIKIPKQDDIYKPFLINKVDLGGKFRDSLIGFAERIGSETDSLKIGEMHEIIQMGLSFRNKIDQGFSRIENIIKNNIIANKNNQEDLDKKIEERLRDNLECKEINKNRNFSLIIYPEKTNKIKNLFDRGENTIRNLLENPLSIRPRYGWSIETLDNSKIIKGKMVRVANGNRKVLDLYEDGMFIFSALANEKFLGWSGNPDSPEINSLAFIEVTFNFLEFYKSVLKRFESEPSNLRLKVIFNNMNLDGIMNRFNYGDTRMNHLGSHLDSVEISENSIEEIIDVSAKDFDSEIVAYKVAKKIFVYLGIEQEVPYTKIENNIRKIDVNVIKSIG